MLKYKSPKKTIWLKGIDEALDRIAKLPWFIKTKRISIKELKHDSRRKNQSKRKSH